MERVETLERQARIQELTFQEVYEKTLRLFQRIVKRAERSSEEPESIPRHSGSATTGDHSGFPTPDPISEMLLKRRNRAMVKLPTDEEG